MPVSGRVVAHIPVAVSDLYPIACGMRRPIGVMLRTAADHLLMARSKGNVDVHRFLAVADGVVRAQGRKIIFTTNLPNIGDIDEALVRPGRCFATVRTRALDRREAASLLTRIAAARAARNAPASAVALAADMRSITLAALYRLVNAEGRATTPAR